MAGLHHSRRAPTLLDDGGFKLIDDLPGGAPFTRALLREALGAARGAVRQECDTDRPNQRGGTPARRLFSSPGGAAQQSLYASDRFLRTLEAIVGAKLRPSGAQGSYSYYVRPGDYLGLHRDILACDVAAITCLCDAGGRNGSGALQLYPSRVSDPLARIRSTPDRGLLPLHLQRGQTIVLLGGYVAHATAAMAEGQKRMISVLCYRGNWG